MRAIGPLFAVSLLLLSCQVNISEEAVFSCAADADCEGAEFRCLISSGKTGICCRVSEESCDGKDNDCNGQVDDLAAPASCYFGPAGTLGVGLCKAGVASCVKGALAACEGEVVPAAERCNSLDDDCDGEPDQSFHLETDPQNCGRCGRICGGSEACLQGECKSTVETQCEDGADNEGDGKTDCADPDCEGKACGAGCSCKSLAKSESGCGDLQDNDGDGTTDCSDPDCNDLLCGQGCTCKSGGKSESGCGDGLDNDGDGAIDCADSDCEGRDCSTGCTCVAGAKQESRCYDFADNDGDGSIDCSDPDCTAKACKAPPSTAQCNAQAECRCNGLPPPPEELSCGDGLDNDCDTLADCADPACNNASCGPGCACRNGAKAEANCGDFTDNDGDGTEDCADATDCPVGSSCKYVVGTQTKTGNCKSDGTCKQ